MLATSDKECLYYILSFLFIMGLSFLGFVSIVQVAHMRVLDRVNLLRELMPLQDHPNLASSLIETIQHSGEALASKRKRRRVYSDLDCDRLTADSDVIEDRCNAYRYQILKGIESNYSNMLQQNASQSDRLDALNIAFEGDPMKTTDLNGILKILLSQRVAVYGGVDPATNVEDPGLIKRIASAFSSELKMHKKSVASLDSLWQSARRVDKAVANILYNQVFQYASLVDKLLKQMSDTGNLILERDIAEMQEAAEQLNHLMSEISDGVCRTQGQLVGLGKVATERAEYSIEDVSKVVDELLSKSEDFLNTLDEKHDEAESVMDQVEESGKSLISTGVDAIQSLSQSFIDTFSTNLEKMIDAFSRSMTKNVTFHQHDSESFIKNETARIVADISAKREKSYASRDTITKRIDALKELLSNTVAATRKAQIEQLASAEDLLDTQKQNTTSFQSAMQQSQRKLSMQVDDASRQVDPLTSGTKRDIGSQLDAVGVATQGNLMGVIADIEKTREQMMRSVSGSESNLAETVSQSSRGIGQDALTAHSILGAQATSITGAQGLAESKVQLAADLASGAISSQISPLLNTVSGTASNTFALSSEITDARNGALTDGRAAIGAAAQATSEGFRSANIQSLLVSAKADKAVAGALGSITRDLEGSESALSGATQRLNDQDGSLANILTGSAASFDQVRNNVATIGNQLASLDDSRADGIDAQVRSAFAQSAGNADGILSKSQTQISAGIEKAKSQLSELIASIRSGLATSMSTRSEEDLHSLLAALSDIQASAQAVADAQAETVQSFHQSITTELKKQSAIAPRFVEDQRTMLDSLDSAFIKKIADSMNTKQESVLNSIRAVNTSWDSAIPASLQARLIQTHAGMDPIVQSMSQKESAAAGNLESIVSGASSLTGKYVDFSKKVTKGLMAMEAELIRTINATGNSFLKSFSGSPEDISARFISASDEATTSLTRAVEGPIAFAAGVGKAAIGDIGIANSLDNDAASVTSIGDVLSNFTSDIGNKLESGRSSVKDTKVGILTAKEYVQHAAALAREIAFNITEFTREGKRQMDETLDRAYALNSKIDDAAGYEGRKIEQELSSNGAGLDLMASSDGAIATKLASSTSFSVADALYAVKSFNSALDMMLEETKSNSSSTSANAQSLQLAMDKVYSETQNSADHQQSALNKSLSMEQSVNKFRLQKVREFTMKVHDSWLKYAHNQKEKFEGMRNTDQVSIQNFMRIAENGLNDGNGKISSLNTTVNLVQDSLNNAKANFSDFESVFNKSFATDLDALSKMVYEATGDNYTIVSMMAEARASWAPNDTSERASVQQKLDDFESSLDQIADRVLTSTS